MESQTLAPPTYVTHHLVKKEDLNHHNTLFAGRSSEWFIEAGFTAVANLLKPQNIVCAKIHELEFLKPVYLGNVICLTSSIIHSGNSSLTVYVKVNRPQEREILMQGFVSFVNVDENQIPLQHGIIVIPETDEEFSLYQKICNFQLMNNRKMKSNYHHQPI